MADGTLIASPDAATAYGGGGIHNLAGAVLSLTCTEVEGNSAIAAAGHDVFGGGLLNEGTASVAGSTFEGNRALGGAGSSFFYGSCGAAIDNFGTATLDVSCSTFSDNKAVGAAGAFGIGGAVENNAGFDGYSTTFGSTATIRDSLFADNLGTGGTAGYGNGGAIDNEGAGTTMSLTRCIVTGNRSVGGPGSDGTLATGLGQGIGGGVMNALYAKLTVAECVIAGNLAIGGDDSTPTAAPDGNPLTGEGDGGGMVNAGWAEMNVSDTFIVGNQAIGGHTTIGPGASALGGAIDNFLYATTSLIGCTIAGNSAVAGSGGTTAGEWSWLGMAAGGGIDLFNYCTVTLDHCLVADNQAIGGSGGPVMRGGNGIGGGIAVGTNATVGFTDGSLLVAHDSTFWGNQARGGDGGHGATGGAGLGGAIYVVAPSTASLDGCTVSSNDAQGGGSPGGGDSQGLGGGLSIEPGATVTVKTSSIRRNRASTAFPDVFGTIS